MLGSTEDVDRSCTTPLKNVDGPFQCQESLGSAKFSFLELIEGGVLIEFFPYLLTSREILVFRFFL